jgi:hypothetical protein
VPLPGVLPDAVINKDYSFGGNPVAIPHAPNNHSSDGKFGTDEWNHVTPAVGRFTNAYIDYADGFLYVLNDWIYNPNTPVSDTCYNLFTAFTGSGQQTWSIRVYGSGLVEVELNGELLAQESTNATGAIGFGVSPKQPSQNHTIFELAFAAMPGKFGVQLHDPGPRFACSVLETEIVNFVGDVKVEGGGFVETVDENERETRQIASFCKPSERGQSAQNCVSLPGLFSDAVINKDYSFGGNPVAIPQAPNNHSSDGKFGKDEWNHVTPAVGRFTNAYIDYADGFLYVLNDWIYNPNTPVSDTCYNLFTAFTGNGAQQWSIRVYGSGLVEVEVNRELLTQANTNATGAIGFGVSPKQPNQNHTIFEVAFAAMPGNFGVQLHDPGPRFACSVLETEVVNFVGTAKSSGGGSVATVDATEFARQSLLRPTTTITTGVATATTIKTDPTAALSTTTAATTQTTITTESDVKPVSSTTTATTQTTITTKSDMEPVSSTATTSSATTATNVPSGNSSGGSGAHGGVGDDGGGGEGGGDGGGVDMCPCIPADFLGWTPPTTTFAPPTTLAMATHNSGASEPGLDCHDTCMLQWDTQPADAVRCAAACLSVGGFGTWVDDDFFTGDDDGRSGPDSCDCMRFFGDHDRVVDCVIGCGRRERHRRQLEASVDLCSCMAWLQFQTTGAAFEHYITSTAFARTDLYKSGAWTTTITTTTFDPQKSIVIPEDESPNWVATVVVVIVLLLVFLALGILVVMKRRFYTALPAVSSAFANPAYEPPTSKESEIDMDTESLSQC